MEKQKVLEKAKKKHANHDKHIHKELDHTLLYPDENEVTNLPGTTKQFKLKEYREEEVWKSYNHLMLFIALKSDYMLSELPNLPIGYTCNDSEDEREAEEQQLMQTSMHNFIQDNTANAHLKPIQVNRNNRNRHHST